MQRRLDDSLGSRRFNAVLIGCFAFIAAILASIGVYGVMSYLVTLRTYEIGIRLALGAQPAQVLHLILREGLALGALGSVLRHRGRRRIEPLPGDVALRRQALMTPRRIRSSL